jgi:hypothetical protein
LFLRRKAAFGKPYIIRGNKKRNREEDDGDNDGYDGINVWDNGNIQEDDNNSDGDDGDEDSGGLGPVANAVLETRYRTILP